MDLGEHITLTGFVESEPGELLVAKKLIGNHARALAQNVQGFSRLALSVSYGREIHVEGTLEAAGDVRRVSAEHANVFFALDACLKKLI
jgi:hypothetical protein